MIPSPQHPHSHPRQHTPSPLLEQFIVNGDETALFAASHMGAHKAVSLLLAHNADPAIGTRADVLTTHTHTHTAATVPHSV